MSITPEQCAEIHRNDMGYIAAIYNKSIELLHNPNLASLTADSVQNQKAIASLPAILTLVAEQKQRIDELEQNICDECTDEQGTPTGWIENRVEGKAPCTCMIEAEPYQVLVRENEELKAHVDRLINAEHCPNYKCNDSGCIPVRNTCNGEWEPEQCEFCYCEPDSFFRAKQETPAQSLAHIKREALQISVEICEEMSDSLQSSDCTDCAKAIKKEMEGLG